MRFLIAACLAAPVMFGCQCRIEGTQCTAIAGSAIAFVGRVSEIAGWRARVVVEEKLRNVPAGLQEVELAIDNGRNCDYPYRYGERYVVFATKITTREGFYFSAGICSHSFRVEGGEHLLEAVRNWLRGGPSRLVGRISASQSGGEPDVAVPVVAQSATRTYTAVSNRMGVYEIRDMAPGVYRVSVLATRLGPFDNVFPVPPGQLLDAGLAIAEKSCEVLDFHVYRPR